MTSTSSSRIRAIQILPTGHLQDTTVPAGNGDAIRELIGCRAFDVGGLDEHIDLWGDDEGAIGAERVLNLPATVLAHIRGVRAVLFGDAVALSVDLRMGESRGLAGAQVQRIRDAVTGPAEPADQGGPSGLDLADAFRGR